MVELPFFRVGHIHRLHHLADQALRQRSVAGDGVLLDAQPLRVFDRALVAVGHADRIGRHVVHEEVREVLGRDDDHRVGLGGAHRLAEAMELRVELVLHRRVGQVRAAGDAGGVAAHACEYETHTPATFSFVPVVMA
ncbi:hypothetical protein D3C72_1846450 [compost metagenome]